MPNESEDEEGKGSLKSIRFIASSQEALYSLPDNAKDDVSYNLYRLQNGKDPRNFDTVPSLGSKAIEIAIQTDNDACHAVYAARLPEAIYVLGVLQKEFPEDPVPQDVGNRLQRRYQQVESEQRTQAVPQGA